MNDLLNWLGVRDNVTFGISVVSFILSVWTAVSAFIRSRECYTVEVIDHSTPRSDVMQLMLCISNCSSSPLTILSFSMFGTTCELRPKKIRGNPADFGFQGTPQFPICVPARGAVYAYVEFVAGDLPVAGLYPGRRVDLTVRSTLRAQTLSITLPDTACYLHRRS